MQLIAQTNRIEAKVDGLVSHERMAEVANNQRQEWRNDIREALKEARHERQNDIQTAINAAKTELRAEIRQSNTDQDRRNEAREELIEKTAKSVRLQFMGIMGMALTGLAYALFQLGRNMMAGV
jgi:F0F1-type ATP synthase membrane subunit b/b'